MTPVMHEECPLQPLSSFLQPEWNIWNRLPMKKWLIPAYESEDHQERMKCLGNLAIPACGQLAAEVLHMMVKADRMTPQERFFCQVEANAKRGLLNR